MTAYCDIINTTGGGVNEEIFTCVWFLLGCKAVGGGVRY